jgi:hypothetical protein
MRSFLILAIVAFVLSAMVSSHGILGNCTGIWLDNPPYVPNENITEEMRKYPNGSPLGEKVALRAKCEGEWDVEFDLKPCFKNNHSEIIPSKG